MSKDLASHLLQLMMQTAFWVSVPVLLSALAVGVFVSILQVVTQIQEMTLTFVPKMFAVAFIITLLSNWMLGKLTEFSIYIFNLAATF